MTDNDVMSGALCSDHLPSVTAVEGGSASLTCRFPALSPQDAVKLIFFYRSANATGPVVYAADARNTSGLSTATHFTGDAARITLELRNLPVVLRISPVFEKDEGFYSCRVDFRRSRTFIAPLYLKVVGKPSLTHSPFERDAKRCVS